MRLPAELLAYPNFVLFRYETREDRRTKVLYDHRGWRGSSVDPATWCAYAEACDALAAGGFDGIGFVLSFDTGIVCVDLDHCRDAETGALTYEAAEIVRLLGSYAEVSPSGTGLHILVRGTVPDNGTEHRGRHNHAKGVEIYASGRFITLTGSHLAGTPESIVERPDALLLIHERYFPRPRVAAQPTASVPVDLDDAELVRRACFEHRNRAKFSALWHGNWEAAGYPSRSEADAALCCHLAFLTGRDPARIERLFSQSGLAGDKWKARPDYRARTIAHAVRVTTETLSLEHGSTARSTVPGRASTLPIRRNQWPSIAR